MTNQVAQRIGMRCPDATEAGGSPEETPDAPPESSSI